MRNLIFSTLFLFSCNLITAQENKSVSIIEQNFNVGKYIVKYLVENRKATRFPKIEILSDEHGSVVVDINIDKYGNVTNASPNPAASDTKSNYLITKAKQAAETTHFDTSPTTPLKTKGSMIFTF